MTGSPAGPLDGVKVLDLCSYLAGPYGCTLLADLGADVIKIESPQGDMLRQFPSSLPGDSRFFLGTNRGKRALALDLKQPEGLAILHRMVATRRCAGRELSPVGAGAAWHRLSAAAGMRALNTGGETPQNGSVRLILETPASPELVEAYRKNDREHLPALLNQRIEWQGVQTTPLVICLPSPSRSSPVLPSPTTPMSRRRRFRIVWSLGSCFKRSAPRGSSYTPSA